jgi:hypothetical protein
MRKFASSWIFIVTFTAACAAPSAQQISTTASALHRGGYFEFTPPAGFELVPRDRVLRGSWGPQLPDEVWLCPTKDCYFTIRLTDKPYPPRLLHVFKRKMEQELEDEVSGLDLTSSEIVRVHDRDWLRFESKRSSGENNVFYYASVRDRLLIVNFLAPGQTLEQYREPFSQSIETFRILE